MNTTCFKKHRIIKCCYVIAHDKNCVSTFSVATKMLNPCIDNVIGGVCVYVFELENNWRPMNCNT